MPHVFFHSFDVFFVVYNVENSQDLEKCMNV